MVKLDNLNIYIYISLFSHDVLAITASEELNVVYNLENLKKISNFTMDHPARKISPDNQPLISNISTRKYILINQ